MVPRIRSASIGVAQLAVLFLVCLATGPSLVRASSNQPTPLHPRALAHPDEIEVRIVPRDNQHYTSSLERRALGPRSVGWDDAFLLSFSAHGRRRSLSLRPSTTIVHHEGAKLVETHTSAGGTRTKVERRLAREEVRAYEGRVLSEDEEDNLDLWEAQERAGLVRPEGADWARIVLAKGEADSTGDWSNIRFQGAFMHDGQVHTIHSTETYLATKSHLDPDLDHIAPRSTASRSMVVIHESSTLTPPEHLAALARRGLPAATEVASSQCGHDKLQFNVQPDHAVFRDARMTAWDFGAFGLPDIRGSRIKRQSDISGGGSGPSANFISSIGSTSGCPKSQKVAFVGVAADCTYTNNYGSAEAARTQLLTDFNSASSLYQSSFNVSLGIVEVNVQSGSCPTTAAAVDPDNKWNVGCEEGGGPGVDLNERLSIFSAWRGSKGAADGAGLWHLLTNCSTGSEVGVAWLGQLCETEAITGSDGQITSGTAVTAITRSSWQVIAHEIGHNVGAVHDCGGSGQSCTLSDSCCPFSTSSCNANANYIMSAVSEKNVTGFSPCTIGNVCTTLSSSVNASCLATPGQSSNPALISLQSCGNGILEAGEDCDPGSSTNSTCCDPQTCKFRSGAVCDPTNDLCCSSTCQIATAGTVCRGKTDDQCDQEETCDGSSAACPADEFTKDGTSCGSNGLKCASGVCTSRDAQCASSGSSLGLSRACPASQSQSCSIACLSPESSSQCVVLQQSFRDGTPCGYGGTCASGSCKSGSALETAKSWYRDNLRISIPVTIVVGLIVLALLWCLFSCCCRRNKAAKAAPSGAYVVPVAAGGGRRGNVLGRRNRLRSQPTPPPGPPPQQWQAPSQGYSQHAPSVHQPEMAYNGAGVGAGVGAGGRRMPPPPPGQWGAQQQGGGWIDPAAYNGNGYPY